MSDQILPEYDPQSGTHEPLKILQAFLAHHSTTQKGDTDSFGSICRVGYDLFGSTFEGAISILDVAETLITRVISAPSQRTAYLVTSSGGKQTTTAKYLCLIPPTTTTTTTSRNSSLSSSPVYYCSCRSFLEKNNRSQHLQLCKHLLALALLPHVGGDAVKYNTIETLSDEEFGRLIVTSSTSPL